MHCFRSKRHQVNCNLRAHTNIGKTGFKFLSVEQNYITLQEVQKFLIVFEASGLTHDQEILNTVQRKKLTTLLVLSG